MDIGIAFPQGQVGADPGAIRAYFEAVEGAGYDYVTMADHILGADVSNRPGWNRPYTHQEPFHEALTLLAFAAACTSRLVLETCVLVLPQRQTALVAKQAAELDVLSGGRVRLGVGLGWNHVEYEALDSDFKNRGRRIEEQIALLRLLWTQESVDFKGEWHTVSQAGINPLPVQRPIPIWMGGGVSRRGVVDAPLRRVARLADGWSPLQAPEEFVEDAVARLRCYVAEAGRDAAAFPIAVRIEGKDGGPEEWRAFYTRWQGLGSQAISVDFRSGRLPDVDAHIKALGGFRKAIKEG